MIYKKVILGGAVMAALSVMIGAFGAHGLKPLFTPEQMNSFETGVRYQFYHSLAMLMVGIIHGFHPHVALRWAGWFFLIGIILFSGSIYTLCYLGATSTVGLGGLGIVTPIGGMFFIIGWLFVVLGLLSKVKPRV